MASERPGGGLDQPEAAALKNEDDLGCDLLVVHRPADPLTFTRWVRVEPKRHVDAEKLRGIAFVGVNPDDAVDLETADADDVVMTCHDRAGILARQASLLQRSRGAGAKVPRPWTGSGRHYPGCPYASTVCSSQEVSVHNPTILINHRAPSLVSGKPAPAKLVPAQAGSGGRSEDRTRHSQRAEGANYRPSREAAFLPNGYRKSATVVDGLHRHAYVNFWEGIPVARGVSCSKTCIVC